MKRTIKKVAVIGSGIMGSGIACHFANIGVEVLLLDIIPRELTDAEAKKGLTLESKIVRNRVVNEHLANSLKSKPSPIYSQKFASRITTGNTTDDMAKIANVDWIIEVVVERLDIKKLVFEQIEKFRKPGTLVTSNTSGIPIHFMSEGRSEDFQQYFCGTHFFNPARYLKLFEIIPGPETSAEVLDFLNEYGSKFLGKTSVVAKDTPAFIGNRIGIYGIQSLFHLVKEMGLTIEEVDKFTVDLAKKWVDLGGNITDVVADMSNGLGIALNSISESLLGSSMEDNLNNFGTSLFSKLSESLTTNLINKKYSTQIFDVNASLSQAIDTNSVYDIVSLGSMYKGITAKAEADRQRIEALSRLFTANRNIDYMDEGITYETGTSQAVNYNITNTNEFNIGNLIADEMTVETFVEEIGNKIYNSWLEKGLKL